MKYAHTYFYCIHLNNNDQVRWENWSRADGSNTTWQTDVPDKPDLVYKWKRMQRRKRAMLAEESLGMEVRWGNDAIHQRPTHQRAQGYGEKKQRRTPAPSTDWDQEVENAYRRPDERNVEDSGPHLRVRRNGSIASIPSRRGARPVSPTQSIVSRDTSSQSSPSMNRRGRPRKDTPSISLAQHAAQSNSSATPSRWGSRPPSSVGQFSRSSYTLLDSNTSQAAQSL